MMDHTHRSLLNDGAAVLTKCSSKLLESQSFANYRAIRLVDAS